MKKLVTLFVFAAFGGSILSAASFGAGDLVVVRVGDGSGALTSAATPVFLDEYTASGTLVQSIPLPTSVSAPNRRLTASGSATSEGFLNLSVDGQYLTLVGYDAASGTAAIASTTSAAFNRVIARVDSSGAVDTTTALTDAYSGSDPRSATSTDGVHLWAGGTGSSTTTAGVRYTTFGATTTTQLSSLAPTNIRVVGIFNNQLYFSTGSGTTGIYTMGVGLPTTSGQAPALVPGATSASPYGFVFVTLNGGSSPDTLYLADDGSGQGVKKYTLGSGGSWNLTGIVTLASARGLTATVSGSTVTLYVVTGNTLSRIIDSSGFGLPPTGPAVTLAAASSNTALRGIAFAPQASVTPTNPSASGMATSVAQGNTTSFSGTIVPGTNPASTGIAVSCDLSSIGGSATFAMTVSGTSFSGSYTVPAGTQPNTYPLPCSVSDDQSRGSTFNISLTVSAPFTCGSATTAIHTIQGTGADSPLNGQLVTVEGIVVGNFRSATQLKGFYLQEPDATWDNNPSTSEGIFIFDNGAGPAVNVGDRVRLQGTVDEFSGSGAFLGTTLTSHLTEIGGLINETVCSTGNSFTRTVIGLPLTSSYVSGTPSWNPDLERYEGMAVQVNQPLTVTGNFSLGTFGQIDIAPALQYAPTDFVGNSLTWAAATDLVQRSVIAIDDGSTLSDASLYPTLFPAPGLSDSNTLRSGDLVTSPLIGILDDRFGEYRIQPTTLPSFTSGNPRPAIAPILSSVGGRFRAVSANVLNFFTTIGSRGAQNATEFQHQKTKVIEALSSMDGDVYGLSEVQNFNDGNTGTGSNSYTNVALQSLVDGLNCKKAGQDALCATPPSTPYSLIDTTSLGGSNGTDAIRTAMIYRPDRVTPIGGPAMYYQNDTNRPTLAQTFEPASGAKADQQTFTFVVNHFRSKSSACGGALDDPFQGNCNGLRLNMAQNVATWLAGNPTGDPSAARKLLLVGDFNAYFGEDPIQYLGSHGYLNLIHAIIGNSAYSYNFGSEAGYLDHTFANSNMNLLVKKVAEWHNNADEPSSLQALDTADKSAAAQAAYYGADPWAASDHDPIVIGFNTLLGDLNDDGVVDAADQALIAGAVGKTAAQAPDRRMDYDGDGKISMNDYKLWQAYYRAYAQ